MKNEMLAFAAGAIFGMLFVYLATIQPGYRNGQIDCLTGKVQYELKTNPNFSTSWVLKKEDVK